VVSISCHSPLTLSTCSCLVQLLAINKRSLLKLMLLLIIARRLSSVIPLTRLPYAS
jgi:hypothetical protein